MIQTIATFNNVELPNGNYSVAYEHIENVQKSEAGTDLTVVSRINKRTVTAVYSVDSRGLALLETASGYSSSRSLEFCGQTFNARCRLQSKTLVEGSERVDNTEGLWEVSLSFVEV